ncbi:MAG TPA: phosphotransferase, partial [Thermoanaerobaculia bacterium]|nr:phosphotransferase [Thermoanaerobaculia bacterium]
AEAVRLLISDPELCRRLGEAGRQKVRNEFDVRRTSEKLVALFDSYEQVNNARGSAAARVRALNWSRLNAMALGVRKVYERPESFIAEVTITDGITKRDVIVRRPRENDDDDPPVVRARNEFEVLSMLRQTLPENHDLTNAIRYTVPRLLMFDEPNAALVVERADGKSLAGSLHDSRRNVPALRRAGIWLHALQANTRSSDDGRHILTAVVLLALRDLDLAAAGDRVLRRQREEIIERLRRLESIVAQRPLPAVGQHGDYSPENIFIGDHRVDVIDFGRYREGLPLEDVAHMLLHLELRFWRWPASRTLPRLRRAFLDGYLDGSGERVIDEEALQLFTLCKALQLLARGGATRGERHVLRNVIARTLS